MNNFIWPIYGTLTGTTTPGQRKLGDHGNEGILHIILLSTIETLPSDGASCYNQVTISIWFIDATLTGAVTPGQSRP